MHKAIYDNDLDLITKEVVLECDILKSKTIEGHYNFIVTGLKIVEK